MITFIPIGQPGFGNQGVSEEEYEAIIDSFGEALKDLDESGEMDEAMKDTLMDYEKVFRGIADTISDAINRPSNNGAGKAPTKNPLKDILEKEGLL